MLEGNEEVVCHVVVYMNSEKQAFRTEVEIAKWPPPPFILVGVLHAIRDLLNQVPSGVLEDPTGVEGTKN